MAYLALYREWRPQNFQEIVGQDHIRTALINALNQNKVAHAYLFSGPRGTGKTTAAKILAKALNCSDRQGAEPCNRCISCQNIDQGIALDVLEIDAASNRGIDEIRDLREKVKFASSQGKYKVYIIDEVHMLTNEAFNALLKTLEEPPAGVVFILATTESHKVPLTILSRVQRYEFHRIPPAKIAERLREVCQSLGRQVEEKALQVIALKAEGGLRDALSILDQCLLQADPLKEEHIYQIIGMVGEMFSADLVDCLLAQDYAQTLAKLDQGVALGRDPRQIIRELLDYLRQALLYTAGGQEPLLSAEASARLIRQSQEAGLDKLLLWINGLLKGEAELRYASNGRLAAEMILIQVLYGQTGAATPPTPSSASLNQVQDAGKPFAQKSTSASRLPFSAGSQIALEKKNRFEYLLSKWPEILEEVKKKKKPTHAFLLQGKPAGIEGDLLYLVFKEGYSFHRDKFNQPENKSVVEQIIEVVLGQKLTLINLMENEFQSLGKERPTGDEGLNGEDLCIRKAYDFFGVDLVQVNKEK